MHYLAQGWCCGGAAGDAGTGALVALNCSTLAFSSLLSIFSSSGRPTPMRELNFHLCSSKNLSGNSKATSNISHVASVSSAPATNTCSYVRSN